MIVHLILTVVFGVIFVGLAIAYGLGAPGDPPTATKGLKRAHMINRILLYLFLAATAWQVVEALVCVVRFFI